MLAAILRWLVAASLATLVTLVIFIAMTRMIDGTWLLDSLIRVFPLTQTEIPPGDECSPSPLLGPAISIEGVVGRYRDGDFDPLPAAEVVGHNALGKEVLVEVSEHGIFRFVTAFADESPSPCPRVPTRDQKLRIRADGCQERSVPVTRAWLPHRVLLECQDGA